MIPVDGDDVRVPIRTVGKHIPGKERRMEARAFLSIGTLAMAAASLAVTVQPALGQAGKAALAGTSWRQPKTPWGDPDLQGTWMSDDCIGTPMNRPVNVGEKVYYTEAELVL